MHADLTKVISHVQRESGEWFVNTIMVEGQEVPFRYKRKKKYKTLTGAKVNLSAARRAGAGPRAIGRSPEYRHPGPRIGSRGQLNHGPIAHGPIMTYMCRPAVSEWCAAGSTISACHGSQHRQRPAPVGRRLDRAAKPKRVIYDFANPIC